MSFKINRLFLQNSRCISKLTNGQMVFSQGRFDNWCIYYLCGHTAHAIKDVEVFRQLSLLRKTELKYMFYRDFCCIFKATTKEVSLDVIKNIALLSKKYPTPSEAEYIFTYLYAGMVAEENKQNAIIKNT